VGKTLTTKAESVGNGKHPHERGEDMALSVDESDVEETPPRAWGRLD